VRSVTFVIERAGERGARLRQNGRLTIRPFRPFAAAALLVVQLAPL